MGMLQSLVASLLAGKTTDSDRSGSAKSWGMESDTGTTGSPDTHSNKTFQDTTANVPNCVERAIPTNQAVLAADKGVYQGTAVYLVVTPDASDGTKVMAYIVDAACVKKTPASSGKVLMTDSYARS